jgi:hypothetical protein
MSRFSEKERSVEQIILDAVNKDESNIKQFHNDHLDYLKQKYKKNNGRKRIDIFDEDFCIGIGEEDETSEGQFLDFIWDSIQRITKMKTNPMSLCEKALLCKKKADDLNLLYKWDKPIMKAGFCTGYGGYDGDDLNELFKKGEITKKLANDYEDYLEFHKESDPILKNIEKIMTQNKISTFRRDEDVWIHNIALYYAENKIELPELIIFYPSNGNSPILDFGYYIISNDNLNEKINEYKKVFEEKEKSDKLLNKILDGKNELSLHQYIMILANYFTEHSRSINKYYIFHPLKKEKYFEDDELKYESITYETICNFKDHSKNCVNEKNIKLINTITEWSKQNNKFKENMSEYDWTNLIKGYYKSNSLNISKDIVLYPKSRLEKEYCLNYYIITHNDLTQENDFFGLMIDSDYSDDDDDFNP